MSGRRAGDPNHGSDGPTILTSAPRVINVDKNAAYPKAIAGLKAVDSLDLSNDQQSGISTCWNVVGEVRSAEYKMIEGIWQSQGMIILEFEDQEHFERWYNSPEYQEILPLRLQATSGRSLLIKLAN